MPGIGIKCDCCTSTQIVVTHWNSEVWDGDDVRGIGTISAYSLAGKSLWVTDLGVDESTGRIRRAVHAEYDKTSGDFYVQWDLAHYNWTSLSAYNAIHDLEPAGPSGGVAKLNNKGQVQWITTFGERADKSGVKYPKYLGNTVPTFPGVALFDEFMWVGTMTEADNTVVYKVDYEGNILDSLKVQGFDFDSVIPPTQPYLNTAKRFFNPPASGNYPWPYYVRVKNINGYLALGAPAYNFGLKWVLASPITGKVNMWWEDVFRNAYMGDLIPLYLNNGSYALSFINYILGGNFFYLFEGHTDEMPYSQWPKFFDHTVFTDPDHPNYEDPNLYQRGCTTSWWDFPGFVAPGDKWKITTQGLWNADCTYGEKNSGARDAALKWFNIDEHNGWVPLTSRKMNNPKFFARRSKWENSGYPSYDWYLTRYTACANPTLVNRLSTIDKWCFFYFPCQSHFISPGNGFGQNSLSPNVIGSIDRFLCNNLYDESRSYIGGPGGTGYELQKPRIDNMFGGAYQYTNCVASLGSGASVVGRWGACNANHIYWDDPEYKNCCVFAVTPAWNRLLWRSDKIIPLNFRGVGTGGVLNPEEVIPRGDTHYGYAGHTSVHYCPKPTGN